MSNHNEKIMPNNVMKIESILKEQEKLDKNGRFSVVNRETGRFIYFLIKAKNPKNVLEIGTSIGYSSLWIASALSRKSKLITLERWPERAQIAKKFFRKSKLNIKLIEGDALNLIPNINSKFDAVFIDAAKADYMNYLKLLIKCKKLRKHTLIVADNTVSHARKMQDFLDFADKNNAVTAEIGKGVFFQNLNFFIFLFHFSSLYSFYLFALLIFQ